MNDIYNGAKELRDPSRWRTLLDDRDRETLHMATYYANRDKPCGLPGHNLLIIVAKLVMILDVLWSRK